MLDDTDVGADQAQVMEVIETYNLRLLPIRKAIGYYIIDKL